MSYKPLTKIYYSEPTKYESEYASRYNSSTTRHIPLELKPYNRSSSHKMFYCTPEDLVLLQDDILSAHSKLIQILKDVPPAGINQFLYSKLIDEIKSSNDIEGVHSTRKEIQAAIDAPPELRHTYRLGGIVNKYIHIIDNKSINLNTSQDVRKLFDEILSNEVCREDPDDLPDGKIFRKNSVSIIGETQKTIHIGILPEEKIISYMDTALLFLNNSKVPLFTRIAIFHYLFGYIHPFYNGNGRMARFITSLYLAKHFHPLVALQLSAIIKEYRKEYYNLFTTVENDYNRGDLTSFVIGTYKFIRKAIQHTVNDLNSKLEEYKNMIILLNKHDGFKKVLNTRNANIICNILLQASIFSDIGATISEITASAKISENTFRKHLKSIPNQYLIFAKSSKPYRFKLDIEKIKATL